MSKLMIIKTAVEDQEYPEILAMVDEDVESLVCKKWIELINPVKINISSFSVDPPYPISIMSNNLKDNKLLYATDAIEYFAVANEFMNKIYETYLNFYEKMVFDKMLALYQNRILTEFTSNFSTEVKNYTPEELHQIVMQKVLERIEPLSKYAH